MDLQRAAAAQSEGLERLPYRVEVSHRNPSQHDVLPRRGAGSAGAVVAEDLREAAELLRVQVALRHAHLDGGVTGLLLGAYRRSHPFLEGGALCVGRLDGGGRQLGRLRLLVVEEEQLVG